MRDLAILDVTIASDNPNEVVISLAGGESNAAGTIRFFEKDEERRQTLRRRAELLMDGNVLVDLAFSFSGGRWRLLGKNREIIGGLEPTKLEINQSRKPGPSNDGNWGLAPPWKDLNEE